MQILKKPISLTLIALVLLYTVGFRIEHPRGGLKNAVASASSSLTIVKRVSKVAPGDKIIVGIKNKPSPVLGIVSGVTGDVIGVQLDTSFERASQKDVAGKLVIVIPFIDSLLSAVGL